MSTSFLDQKVDAWANEFASKGDLTSRDEIRNTFHQIRHLEKKLYCQYQVTLPPNPGYMNRLGDWLRNLKSAKQQKIAFRIAANIFFVGRDEFTSLHKAAFAGPVLRWLISECRLDFCDDRLPEHLAAAVARTWFCPITDSFNINEFMKVNGVVNEFNHRPQWHSHTEFGDDNELRAYISNNRIERIVLLEDFVATGNQAGNAIRHAANIRPGAPVPVLVVPLIQCSQATTTFRSLGLPAHVTIEPVLFLEPSQCVSADPSNNSHTFNEYRELAESTYLQVTNGQVPDRYTKPYHPLGFEQTGNILVMWTNSPDNTLPMVHWSSPTWKPLFPRLSRV